MISDSMRCAALSALVGVVLITASPSCKSVRRLIARESVESSPGASTESARNLEGPSPAPPALPQNTALEDAGEAAGSPEYVAMHVLRVAQTRQGHAVLLADSAEQRVLPILVGPSEALAIELRAANQRYPRPLTHDLLDTIVDKLGGHVQKVQIDAIKNNVFIGRVYVQQGDAGFDVDSRASDAIAVALGQRAPILVARDVIESSSVRREDIDTDRGERTREPSAESQEPTRL